MDLPQLEFLNSSGEVSVTSHRVSLFGDHACRSTFTVYKRGLRGMRTNKLCGLPGHVSCRAPEGEARLIVGPPDLLPNALSSTYFNDVICQPSRVANDGTQPRGARLPTLPRKKPSAGSQGHSGNYRAVTAYTLFASAPRLHCIVSSSPWATSYRTRVFNK